MYYDIKVSVRSYGVPDSVVSSLALDYWLSHPWCCSIEFLAIFSLIQPVFASTVLWIHTLNVLAAANPTLSVSEGGAE